MVSFSRDRTSCNERRHPSATLKIHTKPPIHVLMSVKPLPPENHYFHLGVDTFNVQTHGHQPLCLHSFTCLHRSAVLSELQLPQNHQRDDLQTVPPQTAMEGRCGITIGKDCGSHVSETTTEDDQDEIHRPPCDFPPETGPF